MVEIVYERGDAFGHAARDHISEIYIAQEFRSLDISLRHLCMCGPQNSSRNVRGFMLFLRKIWGTPVL